MATRRGRRKKASGQVTRCLTSTGEAIAGAIHSVTNFGEAIAGTIRSVISRGSESFSLHCLKRSSTSSTDDVVVAAEMEVENLGTEQDPINLPWINGNTKHDLVVFEYIGEF